MTKKRFLWLAAGLCACLIVLIGGVIGFRISFQRPYRTLVGGSGLDSHLIYAVMKTESGFHEDARSSAGAVGLMQLMPATAEFVCEISGIEFDSAKLSEGEYNVKLGCLYLAYLLERFPVTETALCAYNAGEGTVSNWLSDSAYSADGRVLDWIPYPETRDYVKKVNNFRKIYDFFY